MGSQQQCRFCDNFQDICRTHTTTIVIDSHQVFCSPASYVPHSSGVMSPTRRVWHPDLQTCTLYCLSCVVPSHNPLHRLSQWCVWFSARGGYFSLPLPPSLTLLVLLRVRADSLDKAPPLHNLLTQRKTATKSKLASCDFSVNL